MSHADDKLTLETFLQGADQFRLGHLPTEASHPKTLELAKWSRTALPTAIETLTELDREAVMALAGHEATLVQLAGAVNQTIAAGGRIFLCGCGATGRLSISLEVLWRQQFSHDTDRVVSLMAGGDVALVSSIEGFEDNADFGARHLADLGFAADDLLIACTEGGETSYVIGATEYAAQHADNAPYFLYCNPDDVLAGVARSQRVIDNPAIHAISIPIGPMALAGSTRMQASTVLMLAVGLPLLHHDASANISRELTALADRLTPGYFAWLADFIANEHAVYARGDYMLYETGEHAITVFTDTTERAPTFSLAAFENEAELIARPTTPLSLCFLTIPGSSDAHTAWQRLLGRPPRPLAWPQWEHLAGRQRLTGFDFSERGKIRRLSQVNSIQFNISKVSTQLQFRLEDCAHDVDVFGLSLVAEHIVLKLALNIHSTLVMGRLGRYESNVMTWVRPSNRKLIDRAIRYVERLVEHYGGPQLAYTDIARWCFSELPSLPADSSIVLTTTDRILAAHGIDRSSE